MNEKIFLITTGLLCILGILSFLWFSHNLKNFKKNKIKMPKNRFFANFIVLSQTDFWNMDSKTFWLSVFYFIILLMVCFIIGLIVGTVFY